MPNKSVGDQLICFIRVKQQADESKKSSQPYRDYYNKHFITLKKISKRYVDDKTYPTEAGENPEVKTKNRYKDILPFDYTRVKLEKINGEPHSDYINANFVKDVFQKNHYIASQGPMPTTLSDFWRMIWQYKVKVVIMACNEYEGIPPKCTMEEAERLFLDESTPLMFKPKLRCKKYWATENSPLVLDDINLKVSLVRSHVCATGEYLVREMKATRKGEERTVIQLHYEGWPDHGVPETPYPLLDMIAEARGYQGLCREGPPLLIHCSAGCGRTGTIIVIDYCWNLIKTGFKTCSGDFNLHDVLFEMRKQRPSIVQSVEQYEFVHNVVGELFTRQLDAIQGNIYANVSDEEEEVMDEDIYENVSSGDLVQGQEENAYSVPSSMPLPRGKVKKPGQLTMKVLQNQANSINDEADMNQNVSANHISMPPSPKPPISPNRPKALGQDISATKKSEKGRIEQASKQFEFSSGRTLDKLKPKSQNGMQQCNSSPQLDQRTVITIGSQGSKVASKSGHRTVVTVGKQSTKIRHSSVETNAGYAEPCKAERAWSSPVYSQPYEDCQEKASVSGSGTKPKSPTSPSGQFTEYAYADPKSTNKWSLQNVALKGLKSQEPMYASADYEEVELTKPSARKTSSKNSQSDPEESPPSIPDRPVDIFPSTMTTGRKGADTLSIHSATSSTSSNGYQDGRKGSIGKFSSRGIVDTLGAMVGLPKSANPNVKSTGRPEEVYSKGEDISYPNKVPRPKGPRNPANFKIPREFMQHL